ncbi:hypothetical protein BpHYR1_014572 [Brachionus plicatilis]|uniref:Reverse transcriptase domain-containing protein n=1 Tax=Brachionus plicatilis TaxID=10195 RepID=A0A3M7RI39_BRAPC|nr:hypothetical protein BpHYR1_014572 [Brachionus plicatilis]
MKLPTLSNATKSVKTKERPIKLPPDVKASALLFALYINDVANKLRLLKIHFALFADDITVWCASKNLKTIERKLQKANKSNK